MFYKSHFKKKLNRGCRGFDGWGFVKSYLKNKKEAKFDSAVVGMTVGCFDKSYLKKTATFESGLLVNL